MKCNKKAVQVNSRRRYMAELWYHSYRSTVYRVGKIFPAVLHFIFINLL